MPYRASDIEQAVEIAVKVFNRLGKVIRSTPAPSPASAVRSAGALRRRILRSA